MDPWNETSRMLLGIAWMLNILSQRKEGQQHNSSVRDTGRLVHAHPRGQGGDPLPVPRPQAVHQEVRRQCSCHAHPCQQSLPPPCPHPKKQLLIGHIKRTLVFYNHFHLVEEKATIKRLLQDCSACEAGFQQLVGRTRAQLTDEARGGLWSLMPMLTWRIGARFILGLDHPCALKTGHYKPDDNWNAVITWGIFIWFLSFSMNLSFRKWGPARKSDSALITSKPWCLC